MSDGGSFIVLNSYDESEVSTFLENSIRSNPPSGGSMSQDEILRNIQWLGQLFEYSSGMVQQASEIIDHAQSPPSGMISMADTVQQNVRIRSLEDEKLALLNENMELRQNLQELQNMEAAQSTLVPDGVTQEEYDRIVKEKEDLLLENTTLTESLNKEQQERELAVKMARQELLLEVGKWLRQAKPEGLNGDEDYRRWIKDEVDNVVKDRALKANQLNDKEKEVEEWERRLKEEQSRQDSSVTLLTDKMESLQKQLKATEDQRNDLEIQLKEAQSALATKEEDCRRASDQLCDYERQAATNQQPQVSQLQKDLQESQARLRDQEQKVRMADDVKILLQKRLRTVEGERDEAKRLCNEKEKTNAQLLAKCKTLEEHAARSQTSANRSNPPARSPPSPPAQRVTGRGHSNTTSPATSPTSSDSTSSIIAGECPPDLLRFIRNATTASGNASSAKSPPPNSSRRNA